MTRLLMICLAGSVLFGCTPVTKIIPDGHGYIQKTDEHSWWWSNTVSQRRCLVLDGKYCKEDGAQPAPTLVATESFGQGAAKGFISSAPIGIGLGLMRFNQTWANNNIGIKDPVISTLNDNVKYVPITK